MARKEGYVSAYYSRSVAKKEGFQNRRTPKGGTVRTTHVGARPDPAPADLQYVGLVKSNGC